MLGDVVVRFDGVNRGYSRQFAGGRSDQVADLGFGDAGDALNWRGDLCEFKIQLRLLDLCLRRDRRRFGLQVRLHSVVIFFLADGLVLHQWTVAFYVELRLAQSGLSLGEQTFGLVEHRLERTRVNLKQQIAFLDRVALAIVLGLKIASDLRANLRIHQSVQRTDPFMKDGHIGLRYGGNLHHRRWQRHMGLVLAANEAE